MDAGTSKCRPGQSKCKVAALVCAAGGLEGGKQMRRQEREVREVEKIEEIIDRCKVCRIGFSDRGEVYIVPVNFGYCLQSGTWVFYIHGAKKGRKQRLFRQKPMVGFEMDCNHELVCGDTACAYSFQYASVVGTGAGQIVEGMEEKILGLRSIMKHQTGQSFEITREMAKGVEVFKITAEKISCKQSLPKSPGKMVEE